MVNQYLPPVITIPSALEIASISRSFPMLVTAFPNTDQVNTYIPGQLVRLNIPYEFGMFQANGLQVKIIAIVDSLFALDIDSTNFDEFSIPMGKASKPASLSPAGSRNLEYNNFTEVSAFQSLNNIGN